MVQRATLPEWPTFKTRISKWENGKAAPNEFYMSLLCSVLGVSEADLGFSASQRDDSELSLPPQFSQRWVAPEMLNFLTAEFDRYTQVDREYGAQFVIQLVGIQCQTIENSLKSTKCTEREAILRLGAKYFEFAGWLAQDSGNSDQAEKSTTRALDMAYEIGDIPLLSYIFMRRSNIASEAGKSSEALGLARAALRNESQLGPKTLALALRTEGRALALEGNERDAVHALERAVELAAQNGIPEPQAEYCTPSYVQMERSITLMRLGRPNDAIEPLAAAIDDWPEGSDQRDKGLALVRLASIHAICGELDGAFAVGREAMKVVKSAPSLRAIGELLALRKRLTQWKDDRRAAMLSDLIASLRS